MGAPASLPARAAGLARPAAARLPLPGAGARRRARAVVTAARALLDEGHVVGSVGNVSARVGRELRITPTRAAYERMRPRDLVRVDLATGAVRGAGVPSRELPLHLALYRARPDVGAVVHTHSVAATAWSFLGEALAPELEDLGYYDVGAVATAPAAPAGSAELARGAVAALGGGGAVLLGGHGVLTVGRTPEDAVVVARVVERQARVAWLLRGADPRLVG
ncbi:class II aldolase/adducin family protein [Patulibacter sp. SYSU D01012]|uniref:class II aldolase/adducin family protein n=1 Tax=Patulibacter sp. SYSU D01012 TaxID=2817381 RepID=UPI001B314B4D|nr:class II aldolase/adducin family protein [Patulibacter sp. SYSU D01012]